MLHYSRPIARLIEELNKLPGIGPKTAQRLAYHLVTGPKEDAHSLAEAIIEARERTIYCSICCTITDVDPCPLCRDETRDRTLLCVVEEPKAFLFWNGRGCTKGFSTGGTVSTSPWTALGPTTSRSRSCSRA